MTKLAKKRFLMIHRALHDPSTVGVNIAHELHEIRVGKNGCRYLTWKSQGTFMVQNPNKDSVHGIMARNGSTVTWVMRQGRQKWGLIVNGQIKRE